METSINPMHITLAALISRALAFAVAIVRGDMGQCLDGTVMAAKPRRNLNGSCIVPMRMRIQGKQGGGGWRS